LVTSDRHVPQLDSIRAFAVALVMIHHFTPPEAIHGLPLAALGVQLFFVLSGFLITGILLRARATVESGQQRASVAILKFYARRFLRLMPLFYLTLGVAWIAGLPEVRDTLGWHLSYLTNVYFAKTREWHGAVSHLWSLAVEEQFYLAWPFLVVFTPRRFLLAALVGVASVGPIFRIVGTLMDVDGMVLYTLPFGSLDSLTIGGILAYASDAAFCRRDLIRRGMSQAGLWIGGPAILLSCVATLIGADVLDFARDTVEDTVWAFFFVWVIDRGARGFPGIVGRLLELRPLVYIGTISYGLYLLHPFVPGLLGGLLRLADLPSPRGTMTGFMCWSVATVMLASATWYTYERPLNRLKQFISYAPAPHQTLDRMAIGEFVKFRKGRISPGPTSSSSHLRSSR
jgi:peptidoglycan/LPS O-acetylase OafA/YrhL